MSAYAKLVAERDAAVSRAGEQCSQLVDAARAAMARADAAKTAAIADAHRELDVAIAGRTTEIAARVQQTLQPLIASYFREPARSVARDIAASWRALNLEVTDALGAPLGHMALLAAAMAVVGKFDRECFSAAHNGLPGVAAGRLQQAVDAANVPGVEAALSALEVTLQVRGAGSDSDKQLHAALGRCVTQSQFAVARESFEREEKAGFQTKFAANYVPPMQPAARDYNGAPILGAKPESSVGNSYAPPFTRVLTSIANMIGGN